ncbi:methionine--tRNA ligase [Patescibacteria group bacterium]|nr:methionine--tRNA ligase [Patescibacteria group bacterium]MCL5010061.1 methionine--tRNA ligase [Patescibacteria group bacterium]
MNKFYITTAIDYVNDTIHIGHAFQKIASDVLARYYRERLGPDNVFFLTGTDEYGQKAEKAAGESGLTPAEFVKKISDSDQIQQDCLEISYNRFIRTTDKDHAEVVQEIWRQVDKNGDIYLADYTGLYCDGCEAYYEEADLSNGKCSYHPKLQIRQVTEKNYFFKWSRYKEFLIKHIRQNPEFIFPAERAKEMLNFAEKIKDIPISRSNFSWGVPVPGSSEQVIYVWFDALTNYLTGIGFLKDKKLFSKFWPPNIHVLGKDNLRWHALLWPAMLKSVKMELPKTILVNGFLNLNGQKISKSLGNIIRPTDWVEKYGADAVRYYLLRYTVLTEDSDISEEKLKIAYNADLANGLGNLVARVAKLCEKIDYRASEKEIFLDEEVKKYLEKYRFNEALNFIWIKIHELDERINRHEPWKLSEEGLESELNYYTDRIKDIAFNLRPFLPETSGKILKQFTGGVRSAPPLFPRI